MTIAVLGASGRAGKEIVAELVARGHPVRGIARKPEAIPALPGVEPRAGDASDPAALAQAIAGAEAVISALHFDIPAATIAAALRQAGVRRLLVVGGAGSLIVPPGIRLIDSPTFPEAWKGPAQGGVDFLDALRRIDDLDWTFVSPAAFIFEGPRLGTFRLGKDDLVTDDAGESRISFADFAIALVDELEQGNHIRGRFTAAY